jgi:hypothetical protein
LVVGIVVLALSLVPRGASACQWIRHSRFQLATTAELVVVVKAGKLAEDGTQELFPTKVIKHAGAVGTQLRVKTYPICAVSFEEGNTYLVMLTNKQEVLGFGDGLASAPSAELIDAMQRWVSVTKPDEQLALLRQLVKSADPKVAEEARILLQVSTPAKKT